jgi:hypothetical protein
MRCNHSVNRCFGLDALPDSADSACSHCDGTCSLPPAVSHAQNDSAIRFFTPSPELRARKAEATAARLLLPWLCLLQQQWRLLLTHRASLAGGVGILNADTVSFCARCLLTPRCSNPESLFQGHAAWHILSASALVFEFVHVCSAFEQGGAAGQRFRHTGILGMGHLSP